MQSPFVILVDTRESMPWTFSNIPGLKNQGEIVVKTEWQCLGNKLGDYTIKGAESPSTGWRISIERKAINDLYSTILSRRLDFEVELECLNDMEYSAVVVEAPLEKVITYSPEYWKEMEFTPDQQISKRRIVVGSIQAWQLRYPNVRWWFLSRKYAEIWVYRLLYRFWEDRMKGN